MGRRVQRQPTHETRSKVPQRDGGTRMCILVEGHRNDKPGNAEQHFL